jgi:NADH-quinone oxidoreductase subunit G
MTDTVAPATVTITVDGRPVEARRGEPLIQAAERAGVYIPRFCYHPRMRPVGMCRMCLVELKGPRGYSLQPACYIDAAEGQELLTASDNVKKAQDGVLEFLLVNHPLDCPVCDKGGECPLQDQTLTYGPGESRFVEEKRHFAKPIPVSSLVDLDRERCIQCDRCTRFATEVAGDPLINFQGRGDHIEVNTFPGHPFASYFSGNTVQICPVGALTAAPYRFLARPWDLEQVESSCTTCAVGCRMAVQSSANRLVRYLGIDSDPVNHSWLCDKGRFGFEANASPERVTTPLVRRDGQLVPVSWPEALAEAAAGISHAKEQHGAGGVGLLGGARLANEDAYAWAKLAKAVVGTDNVDAQLGDGLPAEVVLGLPRATIDEACSARALLLLAPDLKEELPVLYLRLRSAAVDGLPVVELSATPSSLSSFALELRCRPGELPATTAALLDTGRDDESLAEARRRLGIGGPGVPGEGLVVVVGRPSVAESAESVAEAASTIAASLPGARFLPVLRRGNVFGALDMGLSPGVLPGRVSLAEGRAWFERAWGSVPAEPGEDAAGILRRAAEGRLGALVALGADPVSDFPDQSLVSRALGGIGFLLSVDAFLSSTSRHADVVLPAAMFGERRGTTTNLEGRVSRLGQKVVAPGLCWPDWMIAAELAAHLSADLGFDSLEAIWDEIERLASSHAGVTRELLSSDAARDGVVVPMRPGGPVGTDEEADGPRPVDPMGTPGLRSTETQGSPSLAGAVYAPGEERPPDARTRPSLLKPPPPPPPSAPPPVDGYSLRLVATRRLYDQGVLVQVSPSLAPLAARSRLRANPYDLDRLDVTTGKRVRVSSSRRDAGTAAMVMEAEADETVPRGVAVVGFNLVGEGAGQLIDGDRPVTDVRLETP